MSRPKYLYEIVPHETVLHSDGADTITVQQANLLGGTRQSFVILDRENAEKTRDALDQWLKETASAEG